MVPTTSSEPAGHLEFVPARTDRTSDKPHRWTVPWKPRLSRRLLFGRRMAPPLAGALHAPPGRRRANLHPLRSAPRSMASNGDLENLDGPLDPSRHRSSRQAERELTSDPDQISPHGSGHSIRTSTAWSGRLTSVEADRPLGTRPARPGLGGRPRPVRHAAREPAAAPFAGLAPRRQNLH